MEGSPKRSRRDSNTSGGPVTTDLTLVLDENEGQEEEAEQNEKKGLELQPSWVQRCRSDFPTHRALGPSASALVERRPDKSRLRLLLVRHGESEANINTSILLSQSDHAVALSEEGKKQASACGRELAKLFAQHNETVRVVTSPYKRARDTADIAVTTCGSSRFLSLQENVFLGEMQFGLFEGLTIEQIQQAFPREHQHFEKAIASGGRFYARMPMGESRFDVTGRVQRVIDTLCEDEFHTGVRNYVIVAHGITLRAFAMAWLERTHEWFESQPNPKNCSIRLIEGMTDQGYVFPGFDETRNHRQRDHSDKESDLVALSSQHSSSSLDVNSVSQIEERVEKLSTELAELRALLAQLKSKK